MRKRRIGRRKQGGNTDVTYDTGVYFAMEKEMATGAYPECLVSKKCLGNNFTGRLCFVVCRYGKAPAGSDQPTTVSCGSAVSCAGRQRRKRGAGVKADSAGRPVRADRAVVRRDRGAGGSDRSAFPSYRGNKRAGGGGSPGAGL